MMKKIGVLFSGAVLLLISIVVISGLVTTLPGEALTLSGDKRNTAVYVTMRDGVKIALDVWLPKEYSANEKKPTLLLMTRYWRATDVAFLGRALMGLGLYPASEIPTGDRIFNEEGYVVVRIDARGSGASFGRREMEWSRDEIKDYGEIIDWVVAQPWSNGNVGSFGVSYNGNTAELISINQHPALKAVAPLYGDYDPLDGLVQPGGVKNRYTSMWSDLVGYMDKGDICSLSDKKGFMCFLTTLIHPGVKPVDGPDGRALLRQAINEHDHPSTAYNMSRLDYKDDKLGDTPFITADGAPYGLKEKIEASAVPMHIWLGWMDAATVDGALQRFLSFSNYQSLVIGPYTHGGELDTDPFSAVDRQASPSLEDQYRSMAMFFDCFLKAEIDCGDKHKESQIRYFTMGERQWHTTEIWPPAGIERKNFYFNVSAGLTESSPVISDANDKYVVDFSHDSGEQTRWHTNMGGGDVVYYDRAEQDKKLLTYTSEPLAKAMEITGSPTVSLHLASTRDDGYFFVYLEAVAPDGQVTYLTEGALWSASRKTIACENDSIEKTFGFCRSFLRKDSQPMPIGETVELKIKLYSTSIVVPAGARLRVALAGADATMFTRRPAQGDVSWTIFRDRVRPSGISLPMRWRQ